MEWNKHLQIFNYGVTFTMTLYGCLVLIGQHWFWNGIFFEEDTPGVKDYVLFDKYLTNLVGIFCFVFSILSYHQNSIEDLKSQKIVACTNLLIWTGWTIFDLYYLEYYTLVFKILNCIVSIVSLLYSVKIVIMMVRD